MDSLTLSIAIACVTSVCAAILGILFVFARDEADRLAEENTELRAALEAKRKEADTLSDEVSRLARQIKEQSETLAYREREINRFHARGYIRNAYGTLQRYADWLENGDKKPKPKRTTAQKIKDVGDYFIAETAKIKENMIGPSAESKTESVERKPHQLKPWMQVIRPTKKQRRDIHKACIDAGIKIDPLDELLRHDLVCFGNASDEVVSTWVTSTNDINIPFDEFMARIKGEWPA